MERIVCDQVTRFFEIYGLLTDTALAAMQEDWVANWDNTDVTGILLWDLSAVYNTLSPSLLCEKLKIYRFNQLSCKWFKSYLTRKRQCDRI